MKDLKSNQPLLREMHDHHTLTTAMNEGLDENNRGRLMYRHKSTVVICPNHICTTTTHSTSYSYSCTGNPNCIYNHSRIYFTVKCGEVWLLGYNFHHPRRMMKRIKRAISSHICEYR